MLYAAKIIDQQDDGYAVVEWYRGNDYTDGEEPSKNLIPIHRCAQAMANQKHRYPGEKVSMCTYLNSKSLTMLCSSESFVGRYAFWTQHTTFTAMLRQLSSRPSPELSTRYMRFLPVNARIPSLNAGKPTQTARVLSDQERHSIGTHPSRCPF